ncbi:FRG domain-containing protein [Chloroflexota bacterium]
MQHYGIPTRLLDWTENPLIALYFAFMSTKRNRYKNHAAVWVLDPSIWSFHAINETEIISSNDSDIIVYKPQKKYLKIPENSLPLYGAHNSQRIVAQRGVFVVFGSDTTSMQNQYNKYKYPDESLIRIKLDKDIIPNLLNSVLESGITESVVFPDLGGLAAELRRIFDYN